MNYRHIDTLATKEWFNRPWILLGTGPSLDRYNPEEWRNHNIAAIYDAFYACDHVDILFAADPWNNPVFSEYGYWVDPKNRYVATRGINAGRIGELTNVVMWDYDCDYLYTQTRIFPDIRQYPCSNTSSFAVLWLGTMGVKQIKTFGIDGGHEYSKKCSETYRILNEQDPVSNPNVENEGVFGHAVSFGIEIIRQ
jgi:hypothetical protein